MYDLPSEDPEEPGLPDEFHDLQPQFLSLTLRLDSYSRDRLFTGTDLNLYYDVQHPLWHKRPDWFLVVGVSRLYEGTELRSSYVVWQEGVNPFVVVELLSPGTEKEDLGRYAEQSTESEAAIAHPTHPLQTETLPQPEPGNGQSPRETPPSKWEVYEQILRVPYYVVFSRYTSQMRFFRLTGGHYQEQPLDPDHPRAWIPNLNRGLGLWQGTFEGITRLWLRWYDQQGNWMLTDTELAQEQMMQERQRAEQERQRAEQERQRAEQAESQLQQVARNLLQTGISIAQIAQLTGLPEKQVRQLSDPSGSEQA
jgi:Uma2 family endonuclease